MELLNLSTSTINFFNELITKLFLNTNDISNEI